MYILLSFFETKVTKISIHCDLKILLNYRIFVIKIINLYFIGINNIRNKYVF